MKNIFIYITLIIFAATSVVILPLSSSTSAVEGAICDEATRNNIDELHSMNDVPFFSPCETTCTTGQQTTTSALVIEKSENITAIYTFLTSTPLSSNSGKPLSPAQAAGAMGNMYAESKFDPGAIEDTTRAEKGHGIAQWTGPRWKNLSNYATQQGKGWDDINLQLAFLKTELEGPEKGLLTDNEFSTSTDPSVTALRFRVVFERADPNLAHDDTRILAAISIYSLFGGSAESCSPSSSIVAGDFVQTAIGFALTSPAAEGMVKKSDARDTYQEAKEKLNPSVDWTDCGGYVATALKASGVDTEYPNVNVTAQLAYVKNKPDKYLIIEKPKLSTLERGDILYISGHTTIYTGEAQYPMVDASLNGRVPSVRNSGSLQWMLSQSDIVLARLIK